VKRAIEYAGMSQIILDFRKHRNRHSLQTLGRSSFYRRDALDEMEVWAAIPVCSLIMPCWPGFGDARNWV